VYRAAKLAFIKEFKIPLDEGFFYIYRVRSIFLLIASSFILLIGCVLSYRPLDQQLNSKFARAVKAESLLYKKRPILEVGKVMDSLEKFCASNEIAMPNKISEVYLLSDMSLSIEFYPGTMKLGTIHVDSNSKIIEVTSRSIRMY